METERRRLRCARILVSMLLGALTLVPLPEQAWGHGLGLYTAAAAGDHQHTQFGLTWDTCVARACPFNYRMNLGYESFKFDDDWGETENYHGVILENTFAGRLYASPAMRLWAGPQLITGLYNNDLGLGIGLSAGCNLHASENTSLGLSVGVRRMLYSDAWDDDRETLGFLRLELLFRLGADTF